MKKSIGINKLTIKESIYAEKNLSSVVKNFLSIHLVSRDISLVLSRFDENGKSTLSSRLESLFSRLVSSLATLAATLDKNKLSDSY